MIYSNNLKVLIPSSRTISNEEYYLFQEHRNQLGNKAQNELNVYQFRFTYDFFVCISNYS